MSHKRIGYLFVYLFIIFFKSHSVACQARRRLITGRFFVLFFFIQGDGPINEGGGEEEGGGLIVGSLWYAFSLS